LGLPPFFTNRDFALLIGASPPPFPFFAPWVPLRRGRVWTVGLPTGLRYTNETYWFRFLQAGSTYQSLREMLDERALWCGQPDSPHDDHLAKASVPLFNVGAAGGFATYGLYSTTLVGSTDVSSLIVRLNPMGQEIPDFGHLDTIFASNAPTLVWGPVADWLIAH
jgi:hypothetical protein